MSLDALRQGGKRALAAALAGLERDPDSDKRAAPARRGVARTPARMSSA